MQKKLQLWLTISMLDFLTVQTEISFFTQYRYELTRTRCWATRWNIGSKYSSNACWVVKCKFVSIYFLW